MAEIIVEDFPVLLSGNQQKIYADIGGKRRELNGIYSVCLTRLSKPRGLLIALLFAGFMVALFTLADWNTAAPGLQNLPWLSYPAAACFVVAGFVGLMRRTPYRLEILCASGKYVLVSPDGSRLRVIADYANRALVRAG